MRKIVYALKRIRQDQLRERQAPDTRIRESDDMFDAFDRDLSGIRSYGATETLREVMTSADFTHAIQEFVQRLALPGYQNQTFNFEPLVRQEYNLPNYLPVTRYQNRGSLDDLEYVGEKGQARPGSVNDATVRTLQVWDFAKQYDFSKKALVDDDLGYLQNTAEDAGKAARRTLERYVSRFYTNAVTIARLVGLGALYSTTGRLTTARISEARMAFGQRTDARGNPIVADLRYVVYHRGLEDTVRQIQASELVPELATNAANVVRTGWDAIEDPYIAGAAPNLPWYAFADPNSGNNVIPFVLARRTGMPGPLILRKRSDIEAITSLLGAGRPVDPIWGDFESGNVVFMVLDTWGTYIDGTEGNLFDFRGAYYSAGTAP